MLVFKFGGTSVANADRLRSVATIIANASKETELVVVTSAMSGITNLLVRAAQCAAAKKRRELDEYIEALHRQHTDTITDLKLDELADARLRGIVNSHLTALVSLLESIYILGELTPRAQDMIVSFGERLTVHLLAAAVGAQNVNAEPVEASELIVTTSDFGNARPLLPESTKKMKPVITKLLQQKTIPIVTGFFGATEDGSIATLGRGGSDYSATIIGHCLNADEVWIWTDVDGVMTADPRIVKEARTVRMLTYNEAAELSYFGARVLHPLTIIPVAQKNIPIRIKNTFNPEDEGTKVSTDVNGEAKKRKVISSMEELSLITVQGRGMIGVPGVAAKVFGAIAQKNINVLFISQASSEYNISFIVKQHDGEAAVRTLRRAFQAELQDQDIEMVKEEKGLAILAIVGEGVKGHPDIAGKIFAALDAAVVKIIAIAQGSSERNISIVIAEANAEKAIKHIHQSII